MGPPKRASNAELHGMDGSVTPRAIAYAAAQVCSPVISLPNSHSVQLHFNLTDATHWMNHYNGFSYEEFYEFIVDFFEADVAPEAQGASAELLGWWNKYVRSFSLIRALADMGYSQGSVPKVPGYTRSRT